MFIQTIFLILLATLAQLSMQVNAETASPSFLCGQMGVHYPQGCSGFAAKALGKGFQRANEYTLRGNIEDYSSIPSGTLIGFRGHVGFYYNDYCEDAGRHCKFIDVSKPGGTVRCLNSYGNQNVYFAYY